MRLRLHLPRIFDFSRQNQRRQLVTIRTARAIIVTDGAPVSGEWRWADPRGQQRLVRKDELRAALADGVIPPNAPVWRPGWKDWVPASDVPELMSHALAAANGLVPNVPPPPLFIVAAQSEFESHTPESQAHPGANVEPPPPPRYVPIPPHSSQPNMPGAGSPPPAAAHKASSPKPAPVAAKGEPKKKVNKSTMLGIAPPSPDVVAAAIAASNATGSTGADQLKKALPQDAPASSRLGPDHVAPEAKRSDPPPAKTQHASTVVGVPAINDPRAHPAPAKSDAPKPAPAAATVVGPEGGPPMKRPTLILFGGAPQSGEDGRASSAPPIVAPAPGASPKKNSVTQAPPWDKGAVELGPEIPKNAPMPHLNRRPQENDEEEVSASFLIESTDAGPRLVNPPTAKRQSSIPPPLKAKSIPPPIPAAGKAVSKPPPMPIAGGTKRPPPFVPNFTPPHTTERGIGPLPVALSPAADTEPHGPPAPDAGEADATNKYDSQEAAVIAFHGKSFLTYLDPFVAKHPKLAPTRDKLAAFEKGKPRFVLPLLAGVALFVCVVFLGMIVKAIFGGGGDTTTASTKTDSSASASPHATGATTAPTAAPAHTTTPPPASVSTTPCSIVGSPKTIAGKALVPTGVEVVPTSNSILVGFASGTKDGLVLALDPSSLAIKAQTKTHAGDALKRVEPLPEGGRPQASANVDKKGDALSGRRTVPSSPSFDIGVANGSLAWAPRNTEKIANLWALDGSAPVEALRGAPLDGGGGIAIVFRRSGAIWLGVATGEKSLTPGNLSSTQGLGPVVGSPVIASSGNAALAVWADRATANDAWGLRLQRWKVGDTPAAAEDFTPPAGGLGAPYMSPGVASLTGGRFLLVWTEGPAQGHQVRAVTIGADGQPQGEPLTISAPGENAGQGQAAVTADGRGVVAYFVSNGPKAFALAATAITCPK